MASYHCSVKVGGKGKAGAHAAYISREGKYSGSERYEDIEATGHGNMPKWAERNSAHFWNAADEHERANGATYREIEVSLPRELTPEQRRELVEDFIQQELGERHAYQWAIHTPKASLEGGEQPHAHIMYSERMLDGLDRDPEQYFKRYNAKAPERGGCRKDSAGTEERLQATRERWASVQNAHLERHGHALRVDHRSLEAQGLDRAPEKHLGGRGVRQLQEADISALLERRAAEGERERAQRQVSSVIDLSSDISAAKAERDRRQAEQQAQQRQAELAKQQAAQALAKQREEAERKQQAAQALAKRIEQGIADFERRFDEGWGRDRRQAEQKLAAAKTSASASISPRVGPGILGQLSDEGWGALEAAGRGTPLSAKERAVLTDPALPVLLDGRDKLTEMGLAAYETMQEMVARERRYQSGASVSTKPVGNSALAPTQAAPEQARPAVPEKQAAAPVPTRPRSEPPRVQRPDPHVDVLVLWWSTKGAAERSAWSDLSEQRGGRPGSWGAWHAMRDYVEAEAGVPASIAQAIEQERLTVGQASDRERGRGRGRGR